MHLDTLCKYVFGRLCSPVPPEDPVVDGAPELLLMAGTPYNLTCVTRGAKPAAHIQWNKDGVPVEGAYHSTVIHIHYYTDFTCVVMESLHFHICHHHIMFIYQVECITPVSTGYSASSSVCPS